MFKKPFTHAAMLEFELEHMQGWGVEVRNDRSLLFFVKAKDEVADLKILEVGVVKKFFQIQKNSINLDFSSKLTLKQFDIFSTIFKNIQCYIYCLA